MSRILLYTPPAGPPIRVGTQWVGITTWILLHPHRAHAFGYGHTMGRWCPKHANPFGYRHTMGRHYYLKPITAPMAHNGAGTYIGPIHSGIGTHWVGITT